MLCVCFFMSFFTLLVVLLQNGMFGIGNNAVGVGVTGDVIVVMVVVFALVTVAVVAAEWCDDCCDVVEILCIFRRHHGRHDPWNYL